MTHTDTLTNLTLDETIDLHLEAYAEPDPARRTTLLGQAWTQHGQLFDPPFDGVGPAGIAALVDVVLEHYPAHHFERTTAVDSHHGFARYGWSLVAADGAVGTTGTDVVTVDDDGRLVQVIGFFGDLQPRS
jgi:hypothetical protein